MLSIHQLGELQMITKKRNIINSSKNVIINALHSISSKLFLTIATISFDYIYLLLYYIIIISLIIYNLLPHKRGVGLLLATVSDAGPTVNLTSGRLLLAHRICRHALSRQEKPSSTASLSLDGSLHKKHIQLLAIQCSVKSYNIRLIRFNLYI